MTNEEAMIASRTLPNPRPELTKIFRAAIKRHGLSKKLLENDQLKHKFSVNCSRKREIIAVWGQLNCREMWNLIYKPVSSFQGRAIDPNFEAPVFQYNPSHFLRIKDSTLWLGMEPNYEEVERAFERIVAEIIHPLVTQVQTPKQAAQWSIDHAGYAFFGAKKIEQVRKTWADHYGLEFIPRVWND